MPKNEKKPKRIKASQLKMKKGRLRKKKKPAMLNPRRKVKVNGKTRQRVKRGLSRLV